MMRVMMTLALLALSACATTNPQSGAGISYRMPRTDAKITMGMDVTACAPDLMIATSLKIDAVAGVRDQVFHVSGADLSSSATKRSLTITTDENGVISGVNATATDQQAVILGNIVKIAATAATFAAAPGDVPVVQCSAETKENLATVVAARTQISALRTGLQTSADPEGDQKKINALAGVLATAKAALHADVTGTVKIEPAILGQANAKGVEFDWTPVTALLETAYVGPSGKKPVSGINDDGAKSLLVTAYYIALAKPDNALGGEIRTSQEDCRQWVTVPSSEYVNLVLLRPGTLVKERMQRLSNRPFR